jgi:hypothetical protein
VNFEYGLGALALAAMLVTWVLSGCVDPRSPEYRIEQCNWYKRQMEPFDACRSDPGCKLNRNDYEWYTSYKNDAAKWCSDKVEK